MKYDRIVANDSLNAAINLSLGMFSAKDVKAYIKKFASLTHDLTQQSHTFRELFYGNFLIYFMKHIERDRKIDGKTPDWTIMNNGSPRCLIEVVTFHASQAAKTDATQTDHVLRLYQSIKGKCTKYKDIVLRHGIAYVPCIFLDSDAAVQTEDVITCLTAPDAGLFAEYPHVSGVQLLTDITLKFEFLYIPNPGATHPYMLPGGEKGDYMYLCDWDVSSFPPNNPGRYVIS